MTALLLALPFCVQTLAEESSPETRVVCHGLLVFRRVFDSGAGGWTDDAELTITHPGEWAEECRIKDFPFLIIPKKYIGKYVRLIEVSAPNGNRRHRLQLLADDFFLEGRIREGRGMSTAMSASHRLVRAKGHVLPLVFADKNVLAHFSEGQDVRVYGRYGRGGHKSLAIIFHVKRVEAQK